MLKNGQCIIKNKRLLAVCFVFLVIFIITLIFVVSSRNPYKKMIYEYQNIESTINSALSKYVDENGCIAEEDFLTSIEIAIETAKMLKNEKKIISFSYNEGDTGVLLSLPSGIKYLYSPIVEGWMSGGGSNSKIITIEPYAWDFYGNYLFSGAKGPEEARELLMNEFPNQFKSYRDINDGKNTLQNLLSVSPNSVVIWFGHGAFTNELGSALLLNVDTINEKWLREYEKNLTSGELVLGNSKNSGIYITSKFFDSVNNDTFDNSLFFLGTCSGMVDDRLANSIVKKGASAVVGFDGVVRANWNFNNLYYFFEGTTKKNNDKYFTITESLEYAKTICGNDDDNFFAELFGYNGTLQIRYSQDKMGSYTLLELIQDESNVDENIKRNKIETILENHVEADSIKYFDSTVGYDFSVIEKDGKFGLIDYNGQIILPIEYDSIDLYETAPNGLETKLLAYDANSNAFWVEKDGGLTAGFLGGWGFENGAEIYWMDGPLMFDNFKGKVDYSYDAYTSYRHGSNTLGTITNKTADVIPIQKISGYSSSSDDMLAYSVTKASEKYALFNLKTEQLITDFIFDDYGYNGFIEGILPVQKDGKWGYINDDGKMLTDFIYDTSYETQWGNKHMYSSLNNYSIVRQGNLWGLIDNQGNEILEVMYEGVSQVNKDGYVWLKSNNKWSLCQIAQ